ncbi:hypothetical protein N9Z90_01495, partial [Synechococcus sp. AH-707-D15]|nr:hypothetical protein [Synechococcus sp. AH-707-D15]
LAERLGDRCWRSSLSMGSADAELTMSDLVMGSSGVEGRLSSPLGEGSFHSPLLGRFNVMNLLQAVGVLLQQGLPLESLLKAISTFRGVPGRMERVVVDAKGNELPTVLVDYAHTPDGLSSALKAWSVWVIAGSTQMGFLIRTWLLGANSRSNSGANPLQPMAQSIPTQPG